MAMGVGVGDRGLPVIGWWDEGVMEGASVGGSSGPSDVEPFPSGIAVAVAPTVEDGGAAGEAIDVIVGVGARVTCSTGATVGWFPLEALAVITAV